MEGEAFSVVWRGGGLGWSVWAERRWRGELSPMESDEEIMKFVRLGKTGT